MVKYTIIMKTKHEISAGGIVYKEVKNKKLKRKNVLWLVCRHSQHKGWVFPKGLIGDADTTESMETAARRETREEGGVTARIVAPLEKPIEYFYTFKGEKIKKTVYYYLMEYVSGDPKDHDWEMMDGRFMTEYEVKKILTYASDKKAFDQALSLFYEHP